MSNNKQQWLQNASLNLNRTDFEDHLGHPITDEEWEYMHDIPILTMDDWYGLLLQSQEYLKIESLHLLEDDPCERPG